MGERVGKGGKEYNYLGRQESMPIHLENECTQFASCRTSHRRPVGRYVPKRMQYTIRTYLII